MKFNVVAIEPPQERHRSHRRQSAGRCPCIRQRGADLSRPIRQCALQGRPFWQWHLRPLWHQALASAHAGTAVLTNLDARYNALRDYDKKVLQNAAEGREGFQLLV